MTRSIATPSTDPAAIAQTLEMPAVVNDTHDGAARSPSVSNDVVTSFDGALPMDRATTSTGRAEGIVGTLALARPDTARARATVSRQADRLAAPLSIARRTLAPWRRDADAAHAGYAYADAQEGAATNQVGSVFPLPLARTMLGSASRAPDVSGTADAAPGAPMFAPTARPIVLRPSGLQRSAATRSLEIGRVPMPLDVHPPAMSTTPGTPSTAAPATGAAPPAPGPDIDALVERTCSRLFETLAIEQERRGVLPWR